jgi:hypothetical protein
MEQKEQLKMATLFARTPAPEVKDIWD